MNQKQKEIANNFLFIAAEIIDNLTPENLEETKEILKENLSTVSEIINS